MARKTGCACSVIAAVTAILAPASLLAAPSVAANTSVVPAASPSPSPTVTPSGGVVTTQKSNEQAKQPVQAVPADATVPADVPAAVPEPVVPWTIGDAQSLLDYILQIGDEGLIPADYQPDALKTAIAAGQGQALDAVASKSFNWLAEDLRDGRTPMTARVQWFAVDPDVDENPTLALLTRATSTHDIAGVLDGLVPTYPDYAALKAALAATPNANKISRAKIQANMDRWRWLPRYLGNLYLLTNVPEFQLRLATNLRIVRSYRTIVGKPGLTATPQLAETVKAVVFNPTWTVPQSIVVGEGMGAKLLKNPDPKYKVTKAADGTITIVQQPGPTNSLGLIKIDMPNPHAIYLHDTPNRGLFNLPTRALSHGCVRTDRAQELGMTMAMLGAELTPEMAVANATSGKYTKVTMTKTFPVYITYFTVAQDVSGKLATFKDIYDRDPPVLASFAQPRQLKTTQRASDEKVIKLDNPL